MDDDVGFLCTVPFPTSASEASDPVLPDGSFCGGWTVVMWKRTHVSWSSLSPVANDIVAFMAFCRTAATVYPHGARISKLEWCVVDDFLHYKEGSRLTYSWQRDELLAM